MSIRVLHIIGSMRLGGAQTCLKSLIEGSEGLDVEHFIYPLRPKDQKIFVNCKTFNINLPNYDPRKLYNIIKICKDYNIDIIHTHLDKPAILGVFARIICKTKLVVHDHGAMIRTGIKPAIYRLFLRLFRNVPNRYIAVSNVIKNAFITKSKIEKSKIYTVYNPYDNDLFNPEKYNSSAVRKEMGLHEKDIVIGFVGRLNKIKGIDIAIKTIKLLHDSNPNVKLLIIGEGPEEHYLKTLASSLNIDEATIRFLGFIENIAEIMSTFNFTIMPSISEAFPLVALESLAMNIPLLTSGKDGLAEIVKDGQTGFIAKNNLPEEYADIIKKLLSNKEKMSQIIQNTSKFIKQFTKESYSQNIYKIYQNILNNSQ